MNREDNNREDDGKDKGQHKWMDGRRGQQRQQRRHDREMTDKKNVSWENGCTRKMMPKTNRRRRRMCGEDIGDAGENDTEKTTVKTNVPKRLTERTGKGVRQEACFRFPTEPSNCGRRGVQQTLFIGCDWLAINSVRLSLGVRRPQLLGSVGKRKHADKKGKKFCFFATFKMVSHEFSIVMRPTNTFV